MCGNRSGTLKILKEVLSIDQSKTGLMDSAIEFPCIKVSFSAHMFHFLWFSLFTIVPPKVIFDDCSIGNANTLALNSKSYFDIGLDGQNVNLTCLKKNQDQMALVSSAHMR